MVLRFLWPPPEPGVAFQLTGLSSDCSVIDAAAFLGWMLA